MPPLYSFKANIMRFMPYNFLYDPLSVFQFRSIFINVLLFDTTSKQKHSQCEAHDLLRYNLAPYKPPLYSFKANVMHFMSLTFYKTPSAYFNFDQPSWTYCFEVKLKIDIVSVRHTTDFDTHQQLTYHLFSA